MSNSVECCARNVIRVLSFVEVVYELLTNESSFATALSSAYASTAHSGPPLPYRSQNDFPPSPSSIRASSD